MSELLGICLHSDALRRLNLLMNAMGEPGLTADEVVEALLHAIGPEEFRTRYPELRMRLLEMDEQPVKVTTKLSKTCPTCGKTLTYTEARRPGGSQCFQCRRVGPSPRLD